MAAEAPLRAVLKLNPLSEDETLDPQTPPSHNHYADKVCPHFHTVSSGIQYKWQPKILVESLFVKGNRRRAVLAFASFLLQFIHF